MQFFQERLQTQNLAKTNAPWFAFGRIVLCPSISQCHWAIVTLPPITPDKMNEPWNQILGFRLPIVREEINPRDVYNARSIPKAAV